ncbi:MAG: GHMP kinase [Candidatus Eisenbacteria bacterium]
MTGVVYRAKAPLRISFCGGGTDVSPYPEERGGVVLSSTIDKYAYASIRPRTDSVLRLTSLDYGLTEEHPLGETLEPQGDLALVLGVARSFQQEEPFPTGCDVFLHSDAPPGSGLGSSSTMVTTLVGAFSEWLRRPLTPYEIAERTYQIERIDLAFAGGRQDQYAATFGGFNFIEFFADHTVVNPLRLRRSTQNELEYALLLCFTGRTRASAHIVENQAKSYVEKKAPVVQALDEMKRIATEMKGLLLRDRILDFGEALHEAWLHKKNLDAGITNPHIDELYAAARGAGAVGGKILGAGGGGYLLVLVPFERRRHVEEALAALSGEIQSFAFEDRGLQTWTAHVDR